MVIARRAYQPVALVHKGIGALDHIAASVLLLGRKIADSCRLIRIDVTDREAS